MDPLYISLDDVRVRLIGKVRFTTDIEDENRMHEDLAKRLINEAEGQVELDLSPRYEAPFVAEIDDTYGSLPNRPTKEYIRTLCELQAVCRILETDFGRGTVADSEKYTEALHKRYDDMLKRQMEKIEEGSFRYKLPPLPGLKLNYMNRAADDGFAGAVLTTSDGKGSYPAGQINDPSETFGNASLEDL